MAAKFTNRVAFLLSYEEHQMLSEIARHRRRTVSDTLRQMISESWHVSVELEKKGLTPDPWSV